MAANQPRDRPKKDRSLIRYGSRDHRATTRRGPGARLPRRLFAGGAWRSDLNPFPGYKRKLKNVIKHGSCQHRAMAERAAPRRQRSCYHQQRGHGRHMRRLRAHGDKAWYGYVVGTSERACVQMNNARRTSTPVEARVRRRPTAATTLGSLIASRQAALTTSLGLLNLCLLGNHCLSLSLGDHNVGMDCSTSGMQRK
jgi:hypothetical protein